MVRVILREILYQMSQKTSRRFHNLGMCTMKGAITLPKIGKMIRGSGMS